MRLNPIITLEELNKKDFKSNFFNPQIPVVIKGGSKAMTAYKKWNFEYIKSVAGHIRVPLYDHRPVRHDEGFNEPHYSMIMQDYINLLQSEPTNYRIFLWNLLKEAPILQRDFNYPNLGIGFLKSLPMLFFGGQHSYTFMHYDIDLANIFHYQFQGKKKVILFDQSQTPYLYKVPYSLITREDIDFNKPDFEKWPLLKNAIGYITELDHGDMLYIPEGYWHYMKYETAGFSLSIRSLARKPKNLIKAVYNILVMRNLDNLMRRFYGQKWIEWKNHKALS